ncbi:MAG: GFA family protein [Sphingomicrobium sp.]
MITRTASCRCGQLTATATGEPVRVSVCHCLACQQRSGSAFAVQARWPADQVALAGRSQAWQRAADSGHATTFHFCPDCGSTVHYSGGHVPDHIAIPVGAFADPAFPPPRFSVWEERKHAWVEILGQDVEHDD